MKRTTCARIAFGAGLALAAATCHGAITWGSFSETITTLDGSASWTGSPSPETASTTTPGGNWYITLTFGSTAKNYSVVLDGSHLTAPHPEDNTPGDTIELGVIFPRPTGDGIAHGTTYHNQGVSSGHLDTWDLYSQAASAVDVQFKAIHIVPEPQTYALWAGLGLVGFAVLRKVRR